jgi:hypothetical protein
MLLRRSCAVDPASTWIRLSTTPEGFELAAGVVAGVGAAGAAEVVVVVAGVVGDCAASGAAAGGVLKNIK